MPKISIQLLLWNGAHYLEDLFFSLNNSIYRDFELLVLDNGSTDDSHAVFTRLSQNVDFPVHYFKEKENLGFAGGHNQLFQAISGEYVLLLNQDIKFKPETIGSLLKILESYKEFSGVMPILLRDDSQTIDSLGLKLHQSGKVSDLGSGEEYFSEKFVKNKNTGFFARYPLVEVFGLTGAFCLYRTDVLRQAAKLNNNRLFPDDYHSYKEDIDLAFRLSSLGYRVATACFPLAEHARGFKKDKSIILSARGLVQKFTKPSISKKTKTFRIQSYHNHLFNLFKYHKFFGLTGFFATIFFEKIKAIYILMLGGPRIFIGTIKSLPKLFKIRKDYSEIRQKLNFTKLLRLPTPLSFSEQKSPDFDLDLLVSYVIYGSADLAVKSISTLLPELENSGLRFKIVIVDNMGEDRAESLFAKFKNPKVELKKFTRNLGFGLGNNLAFLSEPAQFYATFNPDTEFIHGKNTVGKMLDFLKNQPSVGLIAPTMLYPNGQTQDSAFSFDLKKVFLKPFKYLTFFRKLRIFRSIFNNSFIATLPAQQGFRPVDWVTGAAMMTGFKTGAKIGFFDPRYFIYFEDADWCREVWRAGLTVCQLTDQKIIHLHARESTPKTGGVFREIFKNSLSRAHIRSWLVFLWKWRKDERYYDR